MLAHVGVVATEERLEDFDFAYPVAELKFGYFMRRPTIGLMKAASLIYSAFTWQFYVVSFATGFLLVALDRASPKPTPNVGYQGITLLRRCFSPVAESSCVCQKTETAKKNNTAVLLGDVS